MKRAKTWAGAVGLALMVSAVPAQADEYAYEGAYIGIEVTVDCDNVDTSSTDPSPEPILSDWTGDYRDYQDLASGISTHGFEVFIAIERDGVALTPLEFSDHLPTYGYHDNWVSGEKITGVITATAWVNGWDISTDTADCTPEPAPQPVPKVKRQPRPQPKIRFVRTYGPRPL